MRRVVEFLKQSQVQYLATVGVDGKPKVRPFQFMFEEEGRLYFCTGNQKPVFRELERSPFVEFCASGPQFSWMRLSGKAVFDADLAVKAKVQEVSPLVRSIYQTPDNPAFEVFHLEQAVATIADFSGNPPETVVL
ncbi:pyridoxamine 5'-phosphate oxidase family protein [Geomonas azotofigens]|uniref:pyridoxamine 5'-phosphate oxidase family protein n=1 Tax=Geomonas azotofigens TaxID=2843196 RepID=UPI001C1293C2|nr:pyridoxamine 5'-phosphate oxidase family protein [Geomonas azotofigens]MBU5612229.1 pyridoxamine 5'-phosphate oxidase family protein [Geomonas azotofigens]